jgi:hypothetical protein
MRLNLLTGGDERILGAAGGRMDQDERPVSINMSAIPVSGVGGLGLVAMAVVVSVFFPAIGWMVAAGAGCGVVLGVALVVFRRRHKGRGPSGDSPRILFEASPPEAAEPPRATRLDPRYSTL